MKRLITLALSSFLLGNAALAENSTANDQLQQWIQDRNAVIETNLQSKIDALLNDRIRQGDRFRSTPLTAKSQESAGNLFAATH